MKNILLVGSGYMAQEYAKVLIALDIPFTVVGRGEKKCEEFRQKYPTVNIYSGGINNYINTNRDSHYSEAIIAVTVPELKNSAELLIKSGIKKILIEKPAGLNSMEIQQLNDCFIEYNANIFVAYNRRFYSSVIAAKTLIEKEGGVTSFCFEFTEWGHQIADLPTPNDIKQNWLLANSSHVIDLAFYLGGYPLELTSYTAGNLAWHKKASRFAGAGICENDVLFSYCANWDAPGRWGVEVLTKYNRYIFRPMERLSKMSKGSISIEEVNIDDSLDIEFKPGLYLQTKAFVAGGEMENNLLSLKEHLKIVKEFYSKISSYNK